MRVPLKGVNTVKKRLRNGGVRHYHYAWKGGPRLSGKRGSPEFHVAYVEAQKERAARPAGDTLLFVFESYLCSPQFAALRPRTRKDYSRHIITLEREFGDFPLVGLDDRRARGEFLAWRDLLATKSRRQADYAFAVLALTLAWARDRGMIAHNPCVRGGKVYKSERSDKIWSQDAVDAFLVAAPPHLHLPFKLALWTGQRQGDLLQLRWRAYDGASLKLQQSKTSVRVDIPLTYEIKRDLDPLFNEAKLREPKNWSAEPIIRTERGTLWTEGGFRASWRKACQRAGIANLSFHDLRGTAVTRLALAGCTVPEIATITGHSLKDVGSIIDVHYLSRNNGLAVSAIRKLEAWAARPNTQSPGYESQAHD